MKIHIVSKIIASCFCAILIASCESREQKADDAFDRVKQAKEESAGQGVLVTEISKQPTASVTIKKIEKPDEWTAFRGETEKKVAANDTLIKAIKSNPNSSSKMLKKLANLEKDNNDLRKQLDEYREEVKVKWETFKANMNEQANEIEVELKDIRINSKK